MKIILVALVVSYLLMAPCFLLRWLKFFKRDTSLSSGDRFLSMMILVIATTLWPVVVPIAYLELLKEKINSLDVTVFEKSNSLRPLLISIFLSNLLTIFGLAATAYLFVHHN